MTMNQHVAPVLPRYRALHSCTSVPYHLPAPILGEHTQRVVANVLPLDARQIEGVARQGFAG